MFHKLPTNLTELIFTFQLKSLCSRMNTSFGGRVTGAAGYCPNTSPSGLRYEDQNEFSSMYVLSW